jgi:cytochrome P450
MLVRAHDEQGQALSNEQLLAHLNILLVAGHETTTNLAAWLLYLLAIHPRYGARVDAELEATLDGRDMLNTSEAVRGLPVLTNAIRETGRLQPPVMFLPRGVLMDVDFSGRKVRVGTPTFLAIAAGHRLPTVFVQPDMFDPDRFAPPREEDRRHPYALATFGGGPRVCLGVNLAHIEVKVLAAYVRQHFRLTPIPGLEIKTTDGVMQCLPEGIRVWVDSLS